MHLIKKRTIQQYIISRSDVDLYLMYQKILEFIRIPYLFVKCYV